MISRLYEGDYWATPGEVTDEIPLLHPYLELQKEIGKLHTIPEPGWVYCCSCECYDTEENPVTKGPDPFQEEINDDDTEVWECESCRCESAADI